MMRLANCTPLNENLIIIGTALLVLGLVFAIRFSMLVALAAMAFAVAIATLFCVFNDASERLDEYDIEQGWQSLVGKD